MTLFTQESLDLLKEKVDLIDVISAHVPMKQKGVSWKGLCPFHNEKTPSFTVQKGASHYHCFGCGAHGDAIEFLKQHLSLSFTEAVEMLADRYGVHLKMGEQNDAQSLLKKEIFAALETANAFFHAFLLHTDEGQRALAYLYERGLDLGFIKRFSVGLAPLQKGVFLSYMRDHKVKNDALVAAGLAKRVGNDLIPFFINRIAFPIQNSLGRTIGFSARLYTQGTQFGPKYMNTSETPVFKKSEVLFGMSFSKKRIIKEKRVLLVEGQIDALRLIYEGLDMCVATQGTAFAKEHLAHLLKLGVEEVYLAFDGDGAGQKASLSVGDMFQYEGIEVKILPFASDEDPDQILLEEGPQGFLKKMEQAKDYLYFLVDYYKKEVDLASPTQKNRMIQKIVAQVRRWQHPLLVHETLRKLARVTRVPEKLVGAKPKTVEKDFIVKSSMRLSQKEGIREEVLEADILRWILLMPEKEKPLLAQIFASLESKHFFSSIYQTLFTKIKERHEKGEPMDIVSLSLFFEGPEEKLFLAKIMEKKINVERAFEGSFDTVKKMREKFLHLEKEKVHEAMKEEGLDQDRVLELAQRYDALTRESTMPAWEKPEAQER